MVLDAEASPFIDVSAAEMLVQLQDALRHKRIDVGIARDIGQVRDVLRSTADGNGPLTVFGTVEQALADRGQPPHP